MLPYLCIESFRKTIVIITTAALRRRRHFDVLHGKSPWERIKSNRGNIGEQAPAERYPLTEALSTLKPRFPSKAFAQMCLDLSSSSLRLERHVVDTLVLGSVDTTKSRDFLKLESARIEGQDALCEFHGLERWIPVDEHGHIEGVDILATKSWLEEMWGWYDARF